MILRTTSVYTLHLNSTHTVPPVYKTPPTHEHRIMGVRYTPQLYYPKYEITHCFIFIAILNLKRPKLCDRCSDILLGNHHIKGSRDRQSDGMVFSPFSDVGNSQGFLINDAIKKISSKKCVDTNETESIMSFNKEEWDLTG